MSDLRNRPRFTGNLGADPELRYTEGDGTPVCTFRMAVSRPKGDATEEKQPLWFKVETWGKTAERAKEMLVKGSNVTVEGRFDVDEWTEDGGKPRFTLMLKNADFLLHSGGAKTAEPPA
jgi:single-strand DNA-binding protein